jgi:putative selenium metabolism hydrolase
MITGEMARVTVAKNRDDLIDFTQRIVATPSLSGDEGGVAKIIVSELKKLSYDEVWIDDVGNIIGKVIGSGGASVMLNGHMDVVDPGPAEGWPQPAFSGAVVDGELWGRGSVDMKGPVASMIYAGAQFKQLGLKPPGDVLMTIAVMEEIGGLGSHFMVRELTADAAIVGEPSRNELRLGHRGRLEIQVKFFGRSAHASAPDLAVNPHYAAAEFLKRIPQLNLGNDPVLGKSTIAPTLYQTDQGSANVIPSQVTLFLDWRNVPAETAQVAVAKLQVLVADCVESGVIERQFTPNVSVTCQDLTTYTGAIRNFAAVFPPFSTVPHCPLATTAKRIVDSVLGDSRAVDVWQFATDGGHLVAAGIPTIGFGPGDDRLAHTNQERIAISDLAEATAVYAPLIIGLSRSIDQSRELTG